MESRFDIVVPTYNRYGELGAFFRNNEVLRAPMAKIWLVDDASTAYNPEVLPAWDNLFHLRMPVNQGQAAVRNYVVENGQAPFVISLDDDAWFEECPDVLQQVEHLFESHPQAGCIMFNVRTPDSSYSERSTGQVIPWHITCGCAYRRRALEDIHGFSGFLHSQAEETDVSIRLYQRGWAIIFSNEIRVFHNFVPRDRSVTWYATARYYTTRNDLLIVMMYYPALLVAPFLAGKFLSHTIFAVRNKMAIFTTLGYTVKAMFSFFLMIPEALRHRRPLVWNQFWSWRAMIFQSSIK